MNSRSVATASDYIKRSVDTLCKMMIVLMKNMASTLLWNVYNFENSDKNNGIIGAGGGYKNLSQYDNGHENDGVSINRLVIIWFILCMNQLIHQLL